MQIQNKEIEIFCGTGGVGKTTLATARAYQLSKESKKVLLMTIDPSKRLKQILGLSEEHYGEICHVDFCQNTEESVKFDALLMSPQKTFERIVNKTPFINIHQNRIISIITKPYGGMNEILSLIELEYHLEQKKYDTIILDTPPGKDFLDFLENSLKIENFFQKKYIDIFEQMAGKLFDTSKSLSFFSPINKIVKLTINKLLSYLENVTGKHFLSEFILAINAVYQVKDPFVNVFHFHKRVLQNENRINFYLVTSIDQNKIEEAIEIKKIAHHFLKENTILLINKTILEHFKDDHHIDDHNKKEFDLINFLIFNENKILKYAKKLFPNNHIFPELTAGTLQENIIKLHSYFKN